MALFWLTKRKDFSGCQEQVSENYVQNIAITFSLDILAGHGSSIGCVSAWYADGCGFEPHIWLNILSLRFGHENVSTTILSLLLIQEGQLSATGERMGTKYW